MFRFNIAARDKKTRARRGILETPRGRIATPCFVPVATKGALRGISLEEAVEFGSDVFMVNTFHFFCNGRYKNVFKAGGLNRFLNVKYPLMTDSGGFQVFSLGSGWEHATGKVLKSPEGFLKKRKGNVAINDDGAVFKSLHNGERLEMTPEISMDIQRKLGADIIFAFDECTSPLDDYEYQKESLRRTHDWARRCLKAFKGGNQVMFGIVQGGKYDDLRKESAGFIGSLPFFGVGIGGSFGESFGDSKAGVCQVLDWVCPLLEEAKPRHLLGIGEPDDILQAVERGVDLFDCVIPTRWARHGAAITSKGRMNLKSSKFLSIKDPIDAKCRCPVCKKHSSSYVSHLLREKEIYGIILLVRHNVFWMQDIMRRIRISIKKGDFPELKKRILSEYGS